jgi:flavin reductase (DIM6/NTAB) family NADH-FMN oxidoreductase RutF
MKGHLMTRVAERLLSPEEFKAAFRNHPGGVAVITADPGTGPVALTATSVISVSADPAVLVFSLSALSSSTPALLESDTLVVHLLNSDDLDVAKLCSTSGVDRFAQPDSWYRLPTGEPVFHTTGTWIRGRIVDRMPIGGSVVVAVQAVEAGGHERAHESTELQQPLVYHNRTWHRLGEHSKI